jgi:hypothetical protein
MKHFLLALALSLPTLCGFTSCAAPAAELSTQFLADSTAVMDFSRHKLGSVTIEEIVKSCQEATQFNFTYTESTQALLRDERVDLPPSRHIPVTDFALILAQNGFAMHAVGPEDLHVISIERRTS